MKYTTKEIQEAGDYIGMIPEDLDELIAALEENKRLEEIAKIRTS